MSRIALWVAVAALGVGVIAWAAGCGGAPATTINVLVPCGQVGPFSEAVKLFQAENPGVKVDWVPENMVTMTRKVLDGKAQPDLFLSMGDLEMDQLEKAGLLVRGTRTKYAENSLAMMVPTGNPAGIKTIADLAKPEVKLIAIPDPEENSAGKHSLEALKKAGIYDKVQSRILKARFAADGKDVVARGDVQVSLGYYPCAVEVHVPGQEPAKPKFDLVGQIPANLYEPFWCEAAVIKGAKNPEGGRKLLEFLKTKPAQDVFVKWQFVREAPSAGSPA